MVRRHVRSEFAADMHVFPGGSVEEDDCSEEASALCGEPREDAGAPTREQGSPALTDLALRLAAIRETFEETGILLACGKGGEPLLERVGDPSRLSSMRDELRRKTVGFTELLSGEGLRPAVEQLRFFARWITPEGMPVRFDARFFLAPAPAGQEARQDNLEVTEHLWVTPAEALRRCREGDFPMLPPTVANLRELAAFGSVEEALEGARGREVRAVMPRLLREGGRVRLLLPGDPGYEG
jgi:8-oxo-dGTP pyrophosphatase MutT (NUDIX family)